MKEVYPEYSDQIAFYAVGTDPSESLERLIDYKEQQGYPWPIAYAGEGTIRNFKVLVQSTKIAFDNQGIITYRDGFGRGDADTWRGIFEELIQ